MYEKIIILVIGFLVGLSFVGFAKSETTNIYNNTDLLKEQSRVLNNCMDGWDSTLKLLKQSNDLIQ